MFRGFEEGEFDTGEVRIRYVAGGSGPPLLMLHGFPQTKAMWGKVAPILARGFQVVASDLRGYGDSSKPACLPDNSNYAFRALADDQLALMRSLGHTRFHVIGHDRGGRTGHRLALDHPTAVSSLTVLDIVPTYAMLMDTNRHVARAYWHWYFLAQPAPFPERLIGHDPDYFFQTCLVSWGNARLEDFDPAMLSEYQRCWRQQETIHGMTSDYRAALTIDLSHDSADISQKITCPTLAFWGSRGVMHSLFDMKGEWAKRCHDLETATLPGGHFFVDQFPAETAERLVSFLKRVPT
jgi:haloacetate dehalogenase